MSLVTSIITGGSNNHETTSTEANAVATDFFSEGVVGAITNTSGVAPATGSFAVNAQGTPDATVAVSSGTAYTTATPTGQTSQLLRTYNSGTENVTISANSSGSTKYDWIYLKIDPDNAADSNAAADNIATLVASRSSSASTDDGTPPTYGTLLAVVTVANGFSTITNANIADKRAKSGPNSIAPADGDSATVATSQTTTSTSYTDLSTAGPSVTVYVGSSGKVLISLTARASNSSTATGTKMGFTASGANTLAADDTRALVVAGTTPTGLSDRSSFTYIITGLNEGRTTFTSKYAVTSGTGTFLDRNISVMPL